MTALPPRRRDVLAALRDIQTETGGYPPTVRELGERLGMRSTSTVQKHIDQLVRHGFVERRGARRIITSAGYSALNAKGLVRG